MRISEAIVLAGGQDTRLNPVTNPDYPKCLLPVANSPALSYALTAIQAAGIQTVFVVANGETAAAKVQKYITKDAPVGDMSVSVVSAAADSGSAAAVRLVAERLTGDAIVVMSGDSITDISLASILFKHRLQDAGMTTVLSKTKTSAADNTKLGKTPKGADYVAINAVTQQLLMYAYDPNVLRKIAVPLAAIQACSAMEVTTNYRDACLYVLSAAIVKRIHASDMTSIKVDALPAIVNEQWSLAPSTPPTADALTAHAHFASLALPDSDQSSMQRDAAAYLENLAPTQRRERIGGPLCAVHLVDETAVCQRMNTMQSYLDINRELANRDASGGGDAVHSSLELGNKAIVGTGCMVAEACSIGDKSSIKRSVIGAHCKIGANVKILNSVILDGCVIGDGVHIQGSIVAFGVTVGAKAQLRDCRVGPKRRVQEGAEHRDEELAEGLS